MFRLGVFVVLFFCGCFAVDDQGPLFPVGEECGILQSGYSSYYQCVLECYQDAFGFRSISGNLCNSSVHMHGAKGGPFTIPDVANSLKCITGKCRNVVPDLVCSPPQSESSLNAKSLALAPCKCEDCEAKDSLSSTRGAVSGNAAASNTMPIDDKSTTIELEPNEDTTTAITEIEKFATQESSDDKSDTTKLSSDYPETTTAPSFETKTPSEVLITSDETSSSSTNVVSSRIPESNTVTDSTLQTNSDAAPEECEDVTDNDGKIFTDDDSEDCESNNSNSGGSLNSNLTEVLSSLGTVDASSPETLATTASVLPSSTSPESSSGGDDMTASNDEDDVISSPNTTDADFSTQNATEDDCEESSYVTGSIPDQENTVPNTNTNTASAYDYYYYYYYYDDGDNYAPSGLSQISNGYSSNVPNSESLQNTNTANTGFKKVNEGYFPPQYDTEKGENVFSTIQKDNISREMKNDSSTIISDAIVKYLKNGNVEPFFNPETKFNDESKNQMIQSVGLERKDQSNAYLSGNSPTNQNNYDKIINQYSENQAKLYGFSGISPVMFQSVQETGSQPVRVSDTTAPNLVEKNNFRFQRYQNSFSNPSVGIKLNSDQIAMLPERNLDIQNANIKQLQRNKEGGLSSTENSEGSLSDEPENKAFSDRNQEQVSLLAAALKARQLVSKMNFNGKFSTGEKVSE